MTEDSHQMFRKEKYQRKVRFYCMVVFDYKQTLLYKCNSPSLRFCCGAVEHSAHMSLDDNLLL